VLDIWGGLKMNQMRFLLTRTIQRYACFQIHEAVSFGRNQRVGYEFGKVGQAELWLRFYSGGLLELLEDVAPGDIIIIEEEGEEEEEEESLLRAY